MARQWAQGTRGKGRVCCGWFRSAQGALLIWSGPLRARRSVGARARRFAARDVATGGRALIPAVAARPAVPEADAAAMTPPEMRVGSATLLSSGRWSASVAAGPHGNMPPRRAGSTVKMKKDDREWRFPRQGSRPSRCTILHDPSRFTTRSGPRARRGRIHSSRRPRQGYGRGGPSTGQADRSIRTMVVPPRGDLRGLRSDGTAPHEQPASACR